MTPATMPGMRALKRRLRTNVTACGLVYRWDARRHGQAFAVIMYHRVVEQPDPYFDHGLSVSTFQAQLRLFKRCCAVLSLDEITTRLDDGKPLPPRCVALTFDDGYRDTSTLAWPLLRQHRFPATLFVAVEALERGVFWSELVRWCLRDTTARRVRLETLKEPPRTWPLESLQDRLSVITQLYARLKGLSNVERNVVVDELSRTLLHTPAEQVAIRNLMLSWDEVKRLSSDGVAIGSHTVTHPSLTGLSVREAASEIETSRRRLAERLNLPVLHFSYPWGDGSPAIQDLVKAAGFRTACTTRHGLNSPSENRWSLKRINGVQASLRGLVRAMTEESGR